MGTVYKGTDTQTGDVVAIKLLKPEQNDPFTFQYALRNIYSLGAQHLEADDDLLFRGDGKGGFVDVSTQSGLLGALRDWGFLVNDHSERAADADAILAYHARLDENRDDLPFEIDGVVVKLDDLAAREELGFTSRHPRWAFAFKFPPRVEQTRIERILASVGRTGVVTPVAIGICPPTMPCPPRKLTLSSNRCMEPPMPCRKRMTIIDSIDQAWESRPPARVKKTMPYWKTRRRP